MIKKFLHALTGSVEINSKNFRVFVAEPVSLSSLEESIEGEKCFSCTREAGEREKLTIQEKSLFGGCRPALEVLGEMALLQGARNKAVAEKIQAPRFVLDLNTVENSSERTNKLAELLARQIADKGKGVVLDWNSGQILYTSPGVKPPTNPAVENDKPQLQIEWSISAKVRPKDFMPGVLTLWQSLEPRLLPLQFGSSGAVNCPINDHNYESFINRLEESANEPLRLVEWHGDYPVQTGSFLHAADASGYKKLPDRYSPRHLLTLQIDMGPFENESDFSAKFEDFFRRTAIASNAFFASAIVIRFGVAPNGWPQYMVDDYSLSFGPWWEGLPSLPYWLGWYGSTYYPLVKEALASVPHAKEFPGQGMLLKLGDFPQNLDELRDKFPQLPKELLLLETTVQSPGSMRSRTYDSAKQIPDL